MRGLLYKDLCILQKSWKTSLISLLCVSWMFFLPLKLVDRQKLFLPIESLAFMIFPVLVYPMIFSVVGNLQNGMFAPDERKCWSSFVISSPLGGKGQVLSKYYIVLLLGFSVCILGFLYDMVSSVTSGVVGSASAIYTTLFFWNIMVRSIELPFLFRYGSRYANNVRTGMFLGIFMIVIIYLLFGPLPQDISMDNVWAYIYQLYNKETALPTMLTGILALMPYAALGMYYISYRISVKLYAKGAMTYEI